MRNRYIGMFSLLVILLLILAFDFGLRGLHRLPIDPVLDVPDGDPIRGRQAIVDYGCGACHTIPGVRMATGRVGPQLTDFRQQIYIAGTLPNTAENLVDWLQAPQQFRPGTAMPDLEVTEADARDIASYLYMRGGSMPFDFGLERIPRE